MVLITHKKGCITLEGHAGYSPHGADIVCASVSALLQTFVASVEEICTDKLNTAITSGNAVIQYRDLTEQAQVLFESLMIGLGMISDAYPDYVRIVK